jgi:hypothetical protein
VDRAREREDNVVKRAIVIALSVVLALTLAMPVAFGQVGQGSKASGTEAAQLAADWWTWALSTPVADNPLLGGDPNYTPEQCDGEPVTDTTGETWFLAGTIDKHKVERTCTVPAGTELFFPVVNYVFVITEPGETQKQARQVVNEFIDSVLADPKFSMVVTVDGEEVQETEIVRADSPLFTIPLPENNLFGVDAGNYQAVADGLWVTLPPLSEGEHTIHVEMRAPSVGFSQNYTYYLTVVGEQ